MVECAIREAFEETGMHLLNDAKAGEAIFTSDLCYCPVCCHHDTQQSVVWRKIFCLAVGLHSRHMLAASASHQV